MADPVESGAEPGESALTADMFKALDAPADEPSAAEPVPAPDSAQAPASEPPTPAPSAAGPSAAPPAPPVSADPTAALPPAADPNTGRMVPLATLLEERGKWEARLAALEAKQAATPPPAPEPETPIPDFLEDPKGYVDAQMARANAALKKLEEGVEKRITPVEARTAEAAVTTAIAASQDAFTAKTPDFKEALDFARVARGNQLLVLNPGTPIEQIVQWVGQEERNLATHLVRQGVNPAERVYQLAKAMGYTPKQAAALAAASPTAASGNGAKVVDPGLTLNSTPGTTHSDVDDAETDILAQAQAERFVRPARRN